MSAVLIYYLANSLLRGGIIVLALLIFEKIRCRKLIFAGGRAIYLAALLLVAAPLEQIGAIRLSGDSVSTPARGIEVPDWNMQWNTAPIAVSDTATPARTQTRPQDAATVSAENAPVRFPVRSWTLFGLLAAGYLAGVLLLSAKQLRHFFLWRNRIRRCIAITDGRVFDVFQESKRLVNAERFPITLLDSGRLLPVAACFGTLRRGAVLCPLEEYAEFSDAELRMVLIHELEHLRRHDNPVAFFLTLLSHLFFVNLFFRFLVARWAMTVELDCDERVRNALRLDQRGMAQYAGLLLASQAGTNAYLPGCGLGSSAQNLKLRIQEFVMKRTKLQLFCSVTGICLVFAMCSLILPELRADSPREPVPAYVAEHLPADTRTLYFFRSAELDANGVKLLQKTSELFATLDRNLFAVLTLMSATEKNKGLFYMAMAPDSWYTLVRNGAKSDEIVLAPNLSHRETTARMLRDGYFLLFPASAKQPKMGLSTELRERIAAEPDDIFRSATSGHPARIRIFKRDGAYMVSALLPEKAEEEFSVAAIIGKATAGLPAAESAEKKAFIEKNLKFSDVTVEGRKLLELEFPLTEETLTEWAEFARRLRDERIRKNAPQVVSVEPANGAEGVDPNLKEIKVTFDRPMSDNSWSFCQRSEIDFPEVLSKPSYNKERTVITLPVRLVPERTYNIYLNSPPFLGFRSAEGGVLPVYHHTFTTGKAAKAK